MHIPQQRQMPKNKQHDRGVDSRGHTSQMSKIKQMNQMNQVKNYGGLKMIFFLEILRAQRPVFRALYLQL